MNDQWSGNTLLRTVRANWAVPSRSSTHFATRLLSTTSSPPRPGSPAPVPEAGADGAGEVGGGDQVALVVEAERQLGQRPGGRAEDRTGAVEHVEGRLVARAQQQALLRLV